jgi:hypothetical protein
MAKDSYTPNFQPNNKKKTIAMLEKAYGFIMSCTYSGYSRGLPDSFLEEGLGRRDKPSGKWLRSTMLTCTDYYTKFMEGNKSYGKAREYVRNEEGCELIKNLLMQHSPDFAAKHQNSTNAEVQKYLSKKYVADQFGTELESGSNTYKDATERKWHTVQGFKSELRDEILSDYGYDYDYDIKSCYPTLMSQYAKEHKGFKGKTPGLDLYLEDPSGFRIMLANQCGIYVDEAKMVITALFNGAPLQTSTDSDIYTSLGKDKKKEKPETTDEYWQRLLVNKTKIKKLQTNQMLNELRADIRKIWKHLKGEFEVGTTATGKKERVSASQKARLYFKLERMVLDAFTEELDGMGVKHFDIHDGCVTSKKLDTEAIQQAIYNKTGFKIQLVLK